MVSERIRDTVAIVWFPVALILALVFVWQTGGWYQVYGTEISPPMAHVSLQDDIVTPAMLEDRSQKTINIDTAEFFSSMCDGAYAWIRSLFLLLLGVMLVRDGFRWWVGVCRMRGKDDTHAKTMERIGSETFIALSCFAIFAMLYMMRW